MNDATINTTGHKFRPFQSVYWCDSERGRNWKATIGNMSYGRVTITIQDNDWPCKRRTIVVYAGNLLPA